MHKKDLGLGIGAIILGIVLFFYFQSIPSGSAFYPKIISIAISILGIVIAIPAVRKLKEETAGTEKKTGEKAIAYPIVALIVVYLFGYYFLFQYVGYVIPTFLLITLTSVTLGYRTWKVLLPSACIVSVGLYLVFSQLFNIRFPGLFF